MTIYRWIKQGNPNKLPIVKIGGRYRSRKQFLNDWAEDRANGSTK